MALNNNADLIAAVADWVNRSDIAPAIPSFISLAEAQINRRLRVRQMIRRSESTPSTEFITLPADFLEPVALTIEITESDVRHLEYLPPDRLLKSKSRMGAEPTGEPAFYAVVGGELQFLPIPSQAYTVELTYFGALPALAIADTNWLLTRYPDVYLYGALVQSAPYLKDDSRTTVWGELFIAALDDCQRANRMPGGKLRTEFGMLMGGGSGFNIVTEV